MKTYCYKTFDLDKKSDDLDLTEEDVLSNVSIIFGG